MLLDNSIQKIQLSSHVEQSVSVDPNVSQQKRQNPRMKKKRHRRKPDDVFEEQSETEAKKNNSDHIDYRA